MRRAGLVLCVMLVGCSRTRSDSGPAESSEERPGEATITSAEVPSSSVTFLESEPRLTRRVEEAIAADPLLALAAKNVGVTVEDGVVTLRGSVTDEEHRRDLERTVLAVPGVARTNDEVEVSLARDYGDRESDDRIAFALQRSLASVPTVADDTDKVSIDVVHGRVILRGSTDFVTTREEIQRIAETTPGVVSVNNALVIAR